MSKANFKKFKYLVIMFKLQRQIAHTITQLIFIMEHYIIEIRQ